MEDQKNIPTENSDSQKKIWEKPALTEEQFSNTSSGKYKTFKTLENTSYHT